MVVLVKGHFHIKANKFSQVAMSVAIFSSKHCKPLVHWGEGGEEEGVAYVYVCVAYACIDDKSVENEKKRNWLPGAISNTRRRSDIMAICLYS